MNIYESKMILTAKKIPNPCCAYWNELVLSHPLTKFGSSCPVVLLYSVVVGRRGRVCPGTLIDSLIPTLINHVQWQIWFLFTGEVSLA